MFIFQVIRWPDEARQAQISIDYQRQTTWPGCVGIIDGTHVRLASCPRGDQDFINRKGFPSMQLQLVIDSDLMITNAYTLWPGCVHDARVLRNSLLYQKAEQGMLMDQNSYLFGDSGYPLKPWLVTPFRDNGHLTQLQRRFNRTLSSCRQHVERVIGHLKGRFRRLREIPCHKEIDIGHLIMSACIMHNLCILSHEDIEDYIDYDIEENDPINGNDVPIQGNNQAGQARRILLMNSLA